MGSGRMKTTTLFKIALQALLRNKLRSFLTILGIIIGVGAVITMVAVGEGAKAQVEAQIASLGSNVMFILPGTVTQGGVRAGFGSVTSLTPDDAKAIERECDAIRLVSPGVRTVAQVVNQSQNWSTAIIGAAPEYEEIRNWPVVSGRYFTQQEVDAAAKVCILGKVVKDNLFGSQDPIGQVVRIKRIPFQVIGVLSEKGQEGYGGDQDDTVIVPYTTAQKKILGITHIGLILTSINEGYPTETAQEQVQLLLRQRHRIGSDKDDDFIMRSQVQIASAAKETSQTMLVLLGSVACVSLIVGGIGIMNIMLVSVTERTREIGIRMAVGAKGRDILLQFLIEAVVLSFIGGIIGILLGIASSKGISSLANWPAVISPGSILVSFFFSAIIGVIFGFYPARKASLLDPIDALRYE